MPDQVIIYIERPEVRIQYIPESLEAEVLDQLAAVELGFHALSRHIREIRKGLGMRVPDEVMAVYNSNAGQRGL